MQFENTIEFAKQLDDKDSLKDFRNKFYIPIINGKECIYFTGNSLGLQPKTTQDYVVNELEDWANFGVEGHFQAMHQQLSLIAQQKFHDKASMVFLHENVLPHQSWPSLPVHSPHIPE